METLQTAISEAIAARETYVEAIAKAKELAPAGSWAAVYLTDALNQATEGHDFLKEAQDGERSK